MEHLLKLSSLTPDEIIHILDVADEYKRLHKAGTDPKDLQGKAVALMFGKHSTRTRTSLGQFCWLGVCSISINGASLRPRIRSWVIATWLHGVL